MIRAGNEKRPRQAGVFVEPTGVPVVEAWVGIEPAYAALQAAA
jgi:hypothetical protein